uniref:Redoxin domain-containing protein n=1 Tax=uncultured Acidobacteriota bacterium TaxID=171953 RepID=G8DPN0_9BACT|nr:redoxin domain-containing protein [uncultured Acidobacteriota bacterium]
MWGKKKAAMLEAGGHAPAFELKSLNGEKRSLDDILAAGPALLAFYKVSCPVCQLTFPYLERLAAGSSLQIIGISQDDDSSTKGFNQRFGVTFPTLLDQSKESYPASNAYGISTVPSLFVVNKDGQIALAFSGFSKRDLEKVGERAGVKPFQPEDNVPEWKAG